MQNQVGIGKQDFAALRESQCFYIDKTDFIRQWWNYRDDVTLITRPRRFGKTLNMSMLNCFFSNKYADRGDLFEGIDIWKDSGYRQIQGTYPVLYLSFASVKADNVSDAKKQVKSQIVSLYQDFEYLLENEKLMESEKMAYRHILTEMAEMDDVTACDSLNYLCRYLEHAYGKKVIILLDEYDTPMQEANVYGYWEEMTSFLRNLFNATFKTNKYCIDGLPNRHLTKECDCMKKKLSVMAVIILVLAICVSAWFYGYYNRKSNDNLPTLTAIAEMSEADVNSLLPGYHIDQLREVWGKPDTSENSTACWKFGNDTTLVVSYKNNGIVAICGLKDDSGASIGE